MGVRRSFGQSYAAMIKRDCIPVVYPGGNRISIQTATGKVLGAPKPGWNSNVGKGLKEFAELPKSQRKPAKKDIPDAASAVYRLPPPPGGLVVLVYTRGFGRDDAGRLMRNELHSKRYSGPQRNYLWLTQAECKSLVPDKPTKGMKFAVADRIAKRIFRHHLVDNTVGLNGSWSADHCREGELQLTVEEVSPSDVRLRLTGDARIANNEDHSKATHKAEFTFLGWLNFNRKQNAFDRLDIVALGDYHDEHVRQYYQKVGQQKSLTLGIACELAKPGSFGYGSVPFALWTGISSSKPGSRKIRQYFGADPYTE